MDKSQAITAFWGNFGLPAYNENNVPDKVDMPYITFNVVLDNLGHPVNLNGNLWYKGTSWKDITLKLEEITKYLQDGKIIPIDGGYMWIVRGSPFAQRVNDDNNLVKRIYINLTAEFLTAI